MSQVESSGLYGTGNGNAKYSSPEFDRNRSMGYGRIYQGRLMAQNFVKSILIALGWSSSKSSDDTIEGTEGYGKLHGQWKSMDVTRAANRSETSITRAPTT